MADKRPNEPRAEDAPQTGPLPEDRDGSNPAESPVPPTQEPTTSDSRDPANVRRDSSTRQKNILPRDEQLAGEKEVEEGIERADDDLRSEANDPTRQ